MDAHQLLTTRIPTTDRNAMNMKLLALAEQIDAARNAANGISEAAMQTGIYGHLVVALIEALKLAAGNERGIRMYAYMVETGEGVQEARRATEPAKA
jgi:hypothetical protein